MEASDTITPTRPVIDFSGPRREDARAYAKKAQSLILLKESHAVFKQVADGHTDVDAYDFHAAVADAKLTETTHRLFGVGTEDLAMKLAYLGHFSQEKKDNG